MAAMKSRVLPKTIYLIVKEHCMTIIAAAHFRKEDAGVRFPPPTRLVVSPLTIMNGEVLTLSSMVEILNELLDADPKATNKLFGLHVNINRKVYDHPTIQVNAYQNKADSDQTNIGSLGVLGLLNGMLCGGRVIIMMTDDLSGKITGFTTGTVLDGKVTPNDAGKRK